MENGGIKKEKQNELSDVKKVIAVVSGKGGVGKSFVTSLLAVASRRRGYKTAVMDADITGPSIPKLFGVKEKATSPDGKNLLPLSTATGIRTMSINYLLPDDEEPVVWRGPMIAGTVKQFWTDVIWDDVDYMFVDMPPGTGDVPLTVFQSLPVDGIVVVTSPQELVSNIVAKAVKMAEMMNVKILGIVENMSYYKCTACGEKLDVFGKSKVEETAKKFGLNKYARIPVDPEFTRLCDEGKIEMIDGGFSADLESMVFGE
ncbi:MAG: Mrp/NBP35 family ATP-binding protein [Clostridia bacterium]|nr:Mrp/NBP35 family ATP-binding protein [Clostridia bacterium]